MEETLSLLLLLKLVIITGLRLHLSETVLLLNEYHDKK